MSLGTNEWVARLDALARSAFEETGVGLSRRHPACHIQTWFRSVGAATSYQGWGLGMECTVGAGDDAAPTICLVIQLGQLGTSTPRLAAEIDGPGGLVMALFPDAAFSVFPDEGTLLTDATWSRLARELPTMLARFESEVENACRRGE